ncbi:hypothetical protein ABW20_dc0105962 [Dactylellina cionopaga]|nr:hypothetical protein ABW20_dc0105962 [Dactylellina cionopaga]
MSTAEATGKNAVLEKELYAGTTRSVAAINAARQDTHVVMGSVSKLGEKVFVVAAAPVKQVKNAATVTVFGTIGPAVIMV